MMIHTLTAPVALLAVIAAAAPIAVSAHQSAPAPAPAPLPSDPAEEDWRTFPADELLVMELTGNRRVVIRLAPRLAPVHVANIRLLAKSGWWDATSIYRVQENWVAQWGDATEKKPLPEGIVANPPPEFDISGFAPAQTLSRPDPRVTAAGITADGWPVATDGKAAWLTHCYGMVGVARDALPNTGTGSELFTPIGQSARRLDRNYTVVGRIIEGMKFMSALPRSDATMGVYATEAERTGIIRVRLASDMAEGERPAYQYRAADNPRFAAMLRLRENPVAPTVGFGGIEICEVPLAVRRVTP